jgi:tripartite-type tricarboxylate transporter receptor subunit TctC
MDKKQRFLPCGLLALALLQAPSAVLSQAFPSKPIRFVVPTQPGGAVDQVARLVAQKMSEEIGQPVIVDNRGGAGGIIGAEQVAHSAPDGYTVLVGNTTTHVASVFLLKSLPYDPLKDFSPITAGADAVECLVVHPSIPANSVAELIELSRRKQAKLAYGSSGTGGAYHLAGELFTSLTGAQITHIPYKGLAPALADVLAGQTAMAFTAISVALPHVRANKLKLLAIVDDKRYARLPDVPALSEAVPGFKKPATWIGFFGPAGLPLPILARLNAEIVKALNAADVRGKLTADGLEVISGTPDQFLAMIKSDTENYGRVVRAAGIKPE